MSTTTIHAGLEVLFSREQIRNRVLEIGRQINHPRRFSRSCSGEPRMSDKLFIDLSGFTAISADGIYAIAAAVIIVIAFVWWR